MSNRPMERKDPPAPYPADTRAKGWRFELDTERIEQSDTWGLAAEVPMAQHALLMVWYAAWTQTPCGSMPADPAMFRVKAKIPPELWPAIEPLAMRGWWLASDGRRYHNTMAERVLAMMNKRRSDADRQHARRAANHTDVTRDKRATPKGLRPESSTGTGTSTGTNKDKGERASAPRAAPAPPGVSAATWTEWTAHRRKKRAPITDLVLRGAQREADKAGIPLDDFLAAWVTHGTTGFRADWIAERKGAKAGQSYEDQALAARKRRWEETTGTPWPEDAPAPRPPPDDVIDV